MVKLECPLAKTNSIVPPIIEFYKCKGSDIEFDGVHYSCDGAAERHLLQRNTSEVSVFDHDLVRGQGMKSGTFSGSRMMTMSCFARWVRSFALGLTHAKSHVVRARVRPPFR